jgi:hypothetical protein
MDSTVSSRDSNDSNDRFIKAMDELKDFVSKTHNNTLKQRTIESYYNKQ